MHPSPLRALSARIRARVVSMSHAGDAAHLGSALSCVDILVAAYFGALRLDPAQPRWPGRDRFILSKGHAAMALYAVLAERGVIDPALLDTFNHEGSQLAEHPPAHGVPGVEAATGSLGHGLPIACGMALAAKVRGERHRVIALLSDGECNEGSVWEAALFAPAKGLDQLTAVIDYNRWQATDRSDEVLALPPLADKWRAFQWHVEEADGHDPEALAQLLAQPSPRPGQPRAVIAHTVKGKGVSFMEDDNNWHYRVPDEGEVAAAHRELLGAGA